MSARVDEFWKSPYPQPRAPALTADRKFLVIQQFELRRLIIGALDCIVLWLTNLRLDLEGEFGYNSTSSESEGSMN